MVWLSTWPFLLLWGSKYVFWGKENVILFVICDIIYCFYKVQPMDGFSSFRWRAFHVLQLTALCWVRGYFLTVPWALNIRFPWHTLSVFCNCVSHLKEDTICLVIEQFLFYFFFFFFCLPGSWYNLWNKFVGKNTRLNDRNM